MKKRAFFYVSLTAILLHEPGMAAAGTCEELLSLSLPDTKITEARTVAAGGFKAPNGQAFESLPAFCEVHGIARPSESSVIHFEVWLPAANWNGRFEGVGNGGLAGTISFQSMAPALERGFATASTDTGHTAAEPRDWLQNRDRLIDYSYRGLHLTAVNAKSIINAYYGKRPSYSYYAGCSTGGKQGLFEAQRFPEDYDGILAGDAANFWTHQMMSEVWYGVVTSTPETRLPLEKLQLLQSAVLKACDALDGVEDGLLSDPASCKFDPKTLQCRGEDSAGCLTAAQVGAVEKIYGGPANPRTGEKLYPGQYPGSEIGWGKPGGEMVINRTGVSSGVSSYDFFRYAVLANPDWDYRHFDFDKDIRLADEKLASITNATNPDLKKFQKLGHKMIYYHGLGDPLIPAANGVDYYESVIAEQGRGNKKRGLEKTQSFFRTFLVPGLYHCAGGPGPGSFGTNARQPAPARDAQHDALAALQEWVENGAAPEKIIATKYTDGKPENGIVMQRPLCPYPQIAKYKGTGSSNDERNFVCAKPSR